MKVFITGGAGFIGSHVARALVDRGDDVVLLDNFDDFLYSPDVKDARMKEMFSDEDRPRLIIGDIMDDALLDKIFSEEKFDVVLHLAALANPGKSLDEAERYTTVNTLGTLHVLEAVRRHGVPRVVYAGSSSVYNDEQTPFVESSYPLRPRSPYGASKAAAETYCAMWHDLHDIPITILRFFSVYGPWGRPDMAPSIFAESIMNGEVLNVTPDRKRDFTYISDTVSGILLALDKEFDFEIINLGRGESVDLSEFVSALGKAAGKEPKIEERPTPPGEMRVTSANIDKAKRLLGYDPKVSIDEGAKKLIDWMKTNKSSTL